MMRTTYLAYVAITLVLMGRLSAQTQPNYIVSEIADPPSRFETRQIDGMCVLPNGKLAVCQPSGEIFFYDFESKEWHLFAQGLHNPLGMVGLSNTELVVSQRPELTKVSDTDGDGKADDYEVVTDQFGMSGNYHEFHFTPVRDQEGNYYFGLGTGSSNGGIRAIVRGEFDSRGRAGRMHASVPYRGCIVKYTTDGETLPWSYGHRTPNGLGFDLKGNLFVTDNQGDWVGSSKLFHVREGHFYGHAASLTWKEGFEGVPLDTPVEELAKLRSRACVVFPHGTMANSPTKVLAIGPEAKFGPFEGQLLVGEMNTSRIVRVMLEEVDGELQGACVPFIDGGPLRRGCNRMAWAPDGSLIVGHTKHTWSGDEGIQQVSWDGKMPFEIQSMNLTKSGFDFAFTRPVDREVAMKVENWPFKRYYYAYQKSYGSPRSDEVDVAIDSISISEDGLKVSIKLSELKAWHVHEVTVKGLKTESGEQKLTNNYIVYTVNRLLSDTPPEPLQTTLGDQGKKSGSKPRAKTIAPSDLKLAGNVYEAEEAEVQGPNKSGSNSGYSGKGYADFGAGKQSITWKLDFPKELEQEVRFRYALGGSARPLTLKVNGETIRSLPFDSSGGWTKWADEKVTIQFKSGGNTVSLHAEDKSGPNVDCLWIETD